MTWADYPQFTFCAQTIDFKPIYSRTEPKFGKAPVETLSPYWGFSLTLPNKTERQRREVEALIHSTGGVTALRVFDTRCPVPAYYFGAYCSKTSPVDLIPTLTVIQSSEADETLTVSGQADDFITQGDPIAFTYNNQRYFHKALEDKRLTGGLDVIKVFYRPRLTASGMGAVCDRIRPEAVFDCAINQVPQETGENGLTAFSLRGIEHIGTL